MQSLSQLCILSNPSLLQFQLQLPAALHEMLGSVDSHVPAPSEPAEHGPSDWPSVEQIHSHIDHSPSGALLQLKDLLLECAQAVSQNDWGKAQQLLGVLGTRLTAPGDSFERVSAYFTAALATRVSRATGTQVSLPLGLIHPPGSDEVLAANLALNQVTPFIRFAHLTANQALLEALAGECYVHIVDLDIVHGLQWPPFMQALADLRADQGPGLPQLRITGIGKDRQILEMTSRRLADFAQSINLPFEFVPLIQNLDSLKPSMLQLRTGEALAVNCMLQLHGLLEEAPVALESFLGMLYSLNPRVVTLAEREMSSNQPIFRDRFADALNHYSTLFDSLDATLPPSSSERIRVEQLWFWKEIANIVGCEESEHIMRYQKFHQWRIFMETAGFQLLSTSEFALSQARLLLRLHYPSEGYHLVEDDGCLLLGWQNRPLFAVSSWNAL